MRMKPSTHQLIKNGATSFKILLKRDKSLYLDIGRENKQIHGSNDHTVHTAFQLSNLIYSMNW